jgi:8-oxo-dGTP pyrophosphatase MutT (NUDIX family)
MDERHVVTVFLENDGKIAIMRRSDRVGTYRGRWGGVAGYLEPGVTPCQQALTEIREETGLGTDDVRLVAEGEVVPVVDEALDRAWLVHPFRFRAMKPRKVTIDWEHTEYRWIVPAELIAYDTVPGLAEAWASVAGAG